MLYIESGVGEGSLIPLTENEESSSARITTWITIEAKCATVPALGFNRKPVVACGNIPGDQMLEMRK